MTQTLYKRDMAHILESVKFGRLYQIQGVHGRKAVCMRCRVVNGNLMLNKGERITIEKEPHSTLQMEPGDFAFVDNASREKRCWSLYKITKKDEK
jgi:hypothetical protein